MTKIELIEKRKKIKKKARVRKRIATLSKALLVVGLYIGINNIFDLSFLDDSKVEYKIPANAISGGEFTGEDGKIYERYQLDNKFYILSKDNGAIMPQN